MKKNLKMLLSIPLYVLLVIFNNCRSMFYNIRHDISFFNSVEFFNIAILVSIIAFVVIMILKDKRGKNNKILVSSLIVILGTSLLNGIFVDKNISMFIVVYFYLLFISFITMLITRQKFEISLVLGVSTLLLFMTVLSIFNLLFLVKYLVIAFIVIGLIIIFFNIKNNKFEDSLEKINCYGIVVFSILFLIAVCGGINRYVHTYDEYSHWAFDAKAVISYDKLSTCQEVVSRTRSYPPVITLWHYFINIFIETFIEQNLYIGLAIFITIFLMPAFSVIEKKNRILLPFLIIAIPFSCYLFGGVYGYETLYADLAFSAILTCCFIVNLIYNDNNEQSKYLFIILSVLTLTKPTGIIASGCFILIVVLSDFLKDIKSNSFRISIYNMIKKYLKLAIGILFIFILWNIYVKVCDFFIHDYYSFELLPDTLKRSLEYKIKPSVMITVIGKFILAFNNKIIYGIVDFSWFQFLFIIFILLFMIFYLLKEQSRLKEIIRYIIPYFVGYLAFIFLTLLSIFCTFTLYETKELASFERYINAFNFAFLIFCLVYISRKRFLKNRNNEIFTFLVLVIIILNIPFNKFTYFISDYYNRDATRKISYELREKFEVVNKNTEEDSQIFIIDQQDKDGIMALWYGRYYMFPRRTNASQNAIAWKIRTNKNIDDLGDWGLKAEELGDLLKKYNFNYVFFYTYDDEMLNNMKDMFTNYEESKEYILFKVLQYNGKVVLEPVA